MDTESLQKLPAVRGKQNRCLEREKGATEGENIHNQTKYIIINFLILGFNSYIASQ